MTPLSPLSSLSSDWPALSELLDEALLVPIDAHDAWLAALDGGRAAHRETLRALLAHRTAVETDDFLGDGPRLAVETATADIAPGVRIGPWRLVSEAGHGGMSTVWLAERADGTMKRRVALKLPRRVWGDVFAERLARERDILGALEHDHIARLLDAGVDAGGRPWLAMEFVAGRPIDVHAREQALGVDARIRLLLQVGAAVAHAHARLVVHRDLKPSNILVTADGQVKLLDFGIAKLLEGDRTRPTALTELGGRALTLDYASPEQIRGEPLGTASDVYSLGVVACELLSGGKPYRLRRGSAAEMEDAIADAEPRLASEAATSPALAKALRGDLDAIVNKALKKRVSERYASVEAFTEDLSRHLAGRPVLARPDSLGYRAARFVGRNRLGVGMGTALTLSVLIGAGVALSQARQARQQERRATAEVARQAAVRDLYIETLTRLSVMGSDSPEALARPDAVTATLREKLAELAPRYRNLPDERAAQLESVMLQLNYANEFQASLEVGQEYLAHLKAHGGSAEAVIDAYSTVGRTLYKLGRLDEAEAIRRAGLGWAPEAQDDRTEAQRVLLGSDLASVLAARGKRAEALQQLTRADATASRLPANGSIRSTTLMQLSIFWTSFDDAKSLAYARQAYANLQADGTSDPEQSGYEQSYLGTALAANGLSVEAEAMLQQARPVVTREFGRGSINEVRAAARLAAAVAQQGDYARAEALLSDEERALAAMPDGVTPFGAMQLGWRRAEAAWLAGDVAPASAWSLVANARWLEPKALREAMPMFNATARLLILAGRLADAAALLDAVTRRWPEPGQPTAAWLRLLETRAVLELAAGRPDAARRTADELLAMLESERSTAGRAYANAAELAALSAVRSGQSDDAARLLGIATSAATPPAFATRVAEAESTLRRAEVLERLGRRDESVALGRSSLVALAGQVAGSPRLALAHRLAGD